MTDEEASQLKLGDSVCWVENKDDRPDRWYEYGEGPFIIHDILRSDRESGLAVAVCIPDGLGKNRRVHPCFLRRR
jgi:hypothetical protein